MFIDEFNQSNQMIQIQDLSGDKNVNLFPVFIQDFYPVFIQDPFRIHSGFIQDVATIGKAACGLTLPGVRHPLSFLKQILTFPTDLLVVILNLDHRDLIRSMITQVPPFLLWLMTNGNGLSRLLISWRSPLLAYEIIYM